MMWSEMAAARWSSRSTCESQHCWILNNGCKTTHILKLGQRKMPKRVLVHSKIMIQRFHPMCELTLWVNKPRSNMPVFRRRQHALPSFYPLCTCAPDTIASVGTKKSTQKEFHAGHDKLSETSLQSSIVNTFQYCVMPDDCLMYLDTNDGVSGFECTSSVQVC